MEKTTPSRFFFDHRPTARWRFAPLSQNSELVLTPGEQPDPSIQLLPTTANTAVGVEKETTRTVVVAERVPYY